MIRRGDSTQFPDLWKIFFVKNFGVWFGRGGATVMGPAIAY